ncbi:MAG: type II restriction endonuclease [Rikenellaceae bacterium]
MKERFDLFMSQLSQTNSTLESLTDFDKVTNNVNKISLKLCQLNHLLGRDDLDIAINEIFTENHKAFSVLGILVAVRDNKSILDKTTTIGINDYFTTVEGICKYIKETGLEDIFKSKKVTNLVDYVFGIEVGLDTNARKNRGGTIMENCVAKTFDDNGIVYRKQVSSADFKELSCLGEDLKRFDFVIETGNKTYFIETNYYNGGGSKLNETARAYTDIAPKINSYYKYEFVWITDGQGWHSAKNKLEEAFNTIPSVYNLKTINEFILKIKK